MKFLILNGLIAASVFSFSTLAQTPKTEPAVIEQPKGDSPPTATVPPTESQPAVETPPAATEPTTAPLVTPRSKPLGSEMRKRTLKGIFAIFEIEQKDQPMGTMKAQLFIDKAPKTVESFIGLVEGTKQFTEYDASRVQGPALRPFYDGLTFHRIVPDYIIQGGCPLGTGKGGPGFTIPDEFRGDLRHDAPGVLSMANTGRKDSAGSQFFITIKGPLRHLDGKFTVFGKLISGLDVAKKISMVKRNPVTEKPIDPVVIKSIKIVREYVN